MKYVMLIYQGTRLPSRAQPTALWPQATSQRGTSRANNGSATAGLARPHVDHQHRVGVQRDVAPG
jgi:hypothetical protein